MKIKFPRLLWLPTLAGIGLLFALFSIFMRPVTAEKKPLVLPPTSPYSARIAGIGVVEPSSEVIQIGTEVPGLVHEVMVKPGQEVKAGQVLFRLDDRDVHARIVALEAALAASRVQAQEAQTQFALVEHLQDGRALSKDEYNRRQFAVKLTQAKQLEVAAQLQQARVLKERMVLKAPIGGEVLSVNVRPGEYAPAGILSEPLMRIGDTSVLHVRVEIDEQHAARLDIQAPAQGSLRGESGRAMALRFVRIEPYVRPKQNLAVSGQRVDTRVLQLIYAIDAQPDKPLVGQQMDVFMRSKP
jgi:HlyD family secretion protein